MDAFMNLAKSLGVGFAQRIEPTAVGHYATQDALLKPEHQAVLEEAPLDHISTDAYKGHRLKISVQPAVRIMGRSWCDLQLDGGITSPFWAIQYVEPRGQVEVVG